MTCPFDPAAACPAGECRLSDIGGCGRLAAAYQTPDTLSEIVAYRVWRIKVDYRGRNPILLSMNGQEWPTDNWAEANCWGSERLCTGAGSGGISRGQHIPGEGCSCGIYAARDRDQLFRDWTYNAMPGVVLGDVGLAGRIIPGTKAYRAARARPLRLYVAHADWRLAKPLSEAYGVPVDLTNPLTRRHRGNRPAVGPDHR